MQATKKQPNLLVLLSCIAALALLIGLGLQLWLGVRSYRESCLAAGELFSSLVQSASEEGEALRAQLFSADSPEGRERRLEQLATRKGMIQRGKELELLTLVNPWHALPEGYAPTLAQVTSWYQVSDDYWVDERCSESLTQMLNDCLRQGHVPIVCSAYRTQEKQQELFDDKISRLIDEGVSPDDAPAVAATVVALPGTSEHQLGLAVDIIDESYPYLDQAQEWTGTQLWLMEHCWEYGFILRYPNGTSDITGIIYEPWHYRYVGVQHALAIRDSGLTLEEYIEARRGR